MATKLKTDASYKQEWSEVQAALAALQEQFEELVDRVDHVVQLGRGLCPIDDAREVQRLFALVARGASDSVVKMYGEIRLADSHIRLTLASASKGEEEKT